MSGPEQQWPEVLVLGSVNRDITVVVEDFPQPGETVMGSSVAYGLGGKGANQAVAAALTGVPTGFLGALGQDQTGDSLAQELAERGVRTEALHRVPGAASGTAHITVDSRGENSIAVVAGANAAVDAAFVHRATAAGLPGARVVVTQGEVPVEGIEAVAQALQGCRARWVLNLAPAVEVSAAALGAADVLVVNETEAAALVHRHGLAVEGPGHAARAAALTGLAPAVIMTVGAEGSLVAVRGADPVAVEAVRAETVVDTTGAGDAYVGVFCAALARALGEQEVPAEQPLEAALLQRCARVASREAAQAVTRPGASSSYTSFSVEGAVA